MNGVKGCRSWWKVKDYRGGRNDVGVNGVLSECVDRCVGMGNVSDRSGLSVGMSVVDYWGEWSLGMGGVMGCRG